MPSNCARCWRGVQDGADAALLVRELNARLGQLGLPAVDWLPDIPVPAWISAPFTLEQFERSQALIDAVCKLDLSNPQSLPPMKRAHIFERSSYP